MVHVVIYFRLSVPASGASSSPFGKRSLPLHLHLVPHRRRNEPPHGGSQNSFAPLPHHGGMRGSVDGDCGKSLRLSSAGNHLHTIFHKKGRSVITCHNTTEHQSARSWRIVEKNPLTLCFLLCLLLFAQTSRHRINVQGVKVGKPSALYATVCHFNHVTLVHPV